VRDGEMLHMRALLRGGVEEEPGQNRNRSFLGKSLELT